MIIKRRSGHTMEYIVENNKVYDTGLQGAKMYWHLDNYDDTLSAVIAYYKQCDIRRNDPPTLYLVGDR